MGDGGDGCALKARSGASGTVAATIVGVAVGLADAGASVAVAVVIVGLAGTAAGSAVSRTDPDVATPWEIAGPAPVDSAAAAVPVSIVVIVVAALAPDNPVSLSTELSAAILLASCVG